MKTESKAISCSRSFTFTWLAFTAFFMAGCLFSEGPVYEEKQVFQDKRMEGDFDSSDGASRSDTTRWSVSRSKQDNKKYTMIFTDGDAKQELTGTLFRLDDMVFLDLFPVKESGVKHVPGGSVTSSEVLHSIMALKKHFVVKIEFGTNDVNYFIPNPNGVMMGSRKAPELKIQPMGEIAALILPSPAKEAQKYLLQFGKDTSVFNAKGHLVKKN
jgi:hypothetical protein